MPNLTQSLIDFINSEEEKNFLNAATATDEEKKGYHIHSDSEANYFIKKYKELAERKNAINKTAQESLEQYQAMVEAWKNKELSDISNSETFFLSILEEYTRNTLAAKGGKKRSVNFIEGTLGFKKQQSELDYNEDQVIEFCKQHLDKAYELEVLAPPKPTTYNINKRALKELVLSSVDHQLQLENDSIPITVIEREDKFIIK